MLKKTRQHLLQLLDGVSPEQLNEVPAGFNNNIIWNLAHVIAAQQGVCYLRAGLQLHAESEALYNRYKPGTRPEGSVSHDDVANIKEMAVSLLETVEQDYNANRFVNYPAWTTRYGAELTTIDKALEFLLFHEGLHTGYIMALKHAVKQ